ncbi:hypothetical protein HYZ64_02005, partial [Candidatus Berkelbacteria bacterium]|nr:hypothetical protein [Candidatus Berkelbacteria bacterium]
MVKKIVIGFLAIIVLIILLLVFGQLRNHIPEGINTVAGPACGSGQLFSVAPVAPTDFLSIVPLGNLSPPDHTVPTDHIYVVIKEHNNIDPSQDKTVRAPGDITIQSINHNTA